MSRGRDQKLIPENPWKLLKTLDFMVMRDKAAVVVAEIHKLLLCMA